MASLKKRGSTYYAQYYVGTKQKRINLGAGSLQIAKEKIRQLESSMHRGDDNPLPTKTPIAKIVAEHVEYMRIHKTARSVERDLYTICGKLSALSAPPLKLRIKRSATRASARHRETPPHQLKQATLSRSPQPSFHHS